MLPLGEKTYLGSLAPMKTTSFCRDWSLRGKGSQQRIISPSGTASALTVKVYLMCIFFGMPIALPVDLAELIMAGTFIASILSYPSGDGEMASLMALHSGLTLNRFGPAFLKYLFSPSIVMHSKSLDSSHWRICSSVTSGIYLRI